MDVFLIEMSNNKLFSGCVMLLTNIGGKYLALDLPSNLEKIFSESAILRFLVIFSIFFMATRDIKIAFLLALLFFIIIKYFINEKSTFCIIKNNENNKLNNNSNKISQDEYNKAIDIINTYNYENNQGKTN
jgi:uncharacterized membrane protein